MKSKIDIGFCLQCDDLLPRSKWGSHFCAPCNGDRFNRNGRAVANNAVALAIKHGVLIKPTLLQCVDCGRDATEYDHRDYSKPLDVEPVCHRCNHRRGPGKWVQYKPLSEYRRTAA